MAGWERLPGELKKRVLGNLDGRNALTARLVSREFNHIIDRCIDHDKVPRVLNCPVVSYNHLDCPRSKAIYMDRNDATPQPHNGRVCLFTGQRKLALEIEDPEEQLELASRYVKFCSVEIRRFTEEGEWDPAVRERQLRFLDNTATLRRVLSGCNIETVESLVTCIGRLNEWLSLEIHSWDHLPKFSWKEILPRLPALRRITVTHFCVAYVQRFYDGDFEKDLVELGWQEVKGFSATSLGLNFFRLTKPALAAERYRYKTLEGIGHIRHLRNLFAPANMALPERVELAFIDAAERGLAPDVSLLLLATAAHCLYTNPSDLVSVLHLIIPLRGWTDEQVAERLDQLHYTINRLAMWYK